MNAPDAQTAPLNPNWQSCPHCQLLFVPTAGCGRAGACPGCGCALAPAGLTAPAAAAAPQTKGFASRHHVLCEGHVVPDSGRCVQCGICSYNCPIGIDVRAHAWRGQPVHDSHCLTCGECVKRCPRGVLNFEEIPLLKVK
jgi:ferredoxin